MQEFSSISVSSYDAGSLADRLTEQSANGWDVVSIVPAGTNVVAYLSRTSSDEHAAADTASSDEAVATPAAETSVTDAPAVEEPAAQVAEEVDARVIQMPVAAAAAAAPAAPEAPATDAGSWASGAAELSSDHDVTDDAADDITAAIAAPVSASPADDWSDLVANITDEDTGTAPAADAVAEPAGWGSTPDPVVAEPALSSVADTAASVPSVESTSEAPASTASASAETAAASTTASAGEAPAGWYADPSSRFELRYWDGSQWTEHVSRGGQQFTDPPVA